MDLDYIKGVNLGNWLVLEKWMNPALFDGTTADDEYYLPTQLDPAVYEARIRTHRAEYINERDFATIKSWGLNSVRIPVPYFIFGDRAPFIGCIDELDKAFNWAEKYGLTILIDLHTAPMSQNGFDNGGISGVCKWAQLPDEVEFVLSVLERLARRYGHRRALMGIEIINEPNTTTCWPMANVTERYKAVDPELAEGTGPIAFDWLKNFYITAYHRLRDADKGALPADKAVVFHDGFDIEQWKDFMRGPDGKLAPEFKNVVLDTHQYLMTAETMGCPQTAEGYDDFVRNTYAPMIAEMSEYFPVIVGEWCLFNSVGCGVDTHGGQSVLNGEEGAQAETLTAEAKKKADEQIEQATRRKQGIDQEADRRIGESREQAQKLLSDANTEADRILRPAEEKAAGIDAEAKARIADADRREHEAARTVDQARRLLADAAARLARPMPELPATNPRE